MELKLKLLSLLCLILVQVHSQDIEPEFPEEFPTTTTAPAAATTTTPSDVELVETTTTTESQTEATTTEMPRTSTESTPSTTTNRLPFYPTYIPPPLPTYLPPFKPHYSTTTHNPIYWDLGSDSNEEPLCYLREQEERSYVRWNCGMSSWSPIKNCYRCCYYDYSRFAGCNKLYNGPCRNAISASWYI